MESMSSRSNSRSSEYRNDDPLLPCLEKFPKKRSPIRAVFGHVLYRRMLRWTVVSLLLLLFLAAFLFKGSEVSAHAVIRFGSSRLLKTASTDPSPGRGNRGDEYEGLSEEERQRERENKAEFEEARKKMPWIVFKHLDGYYHGLKALVDKSHHVPEYPNATREAPLPQPPLHQGVRKPRPYNPYPSSKGIKTCYLDRERKVPAPAVYAYDGVPQHMPDPVIGSYDIFGIRDDVCFDRFGRYGPYGLGYSRQSGGPVIGKVTESSGNEAVWARTGQINYDNVDWGNAQERCSAANKHRFLEPDPRTEELPAAVGKNKGKKGRIAVVVRCYQGFKWTELAILNFRAMVTELSLKSGGEYTVHLLLHVHDTDQAIWADNDPMQRLVQSNVPAEFHSLVTIWSEPQMGLVYPGRFGESLENLSGFDVHNVYRSAHMPLQLFAIQHPEYEHIWNWEMDIRCLGNYYEFFDRIGRWADRQPRTLLWERNARYYVPSYHGSCDNFSTTVRRDTEQSGVQAILGPVSFTGRRPLWREERGESMLPSSCDSSRGSSRDSGRDSSRGSGRSSSRTSKRDAAECGVGEAADIITLNPIFDTYQSGWIFSNDVTGYIDASVSHPPRRCSIVTASRLSRRLLTAMHEETWRLQHSMFSEMFPSTIALHHGLKAVYAPHPIYFERAWQPLGSSIDAAFNSGKHHSTSGKDSPYNMDNEHNHKGTTWYFHSEFAGLLWRRWLGYMQRDSRGKFGAIGALRGGLVDESGDKSSGRMCLRSMLVHPIKHEHPLG